MTKQEAAIVSAYTGVLIGSFCDMHKYIEAIMGRSVLTHELADKDVWSEIKRKSKPDFMSMEITLPKKAGD